MSLFDAFQQKMPQVATLLADPRLRELLTRRELRVTDDYLNREIMQQAGDDELHGLSLRFLEGYGELSGTVRKRLLPAIPFSARFNVHGVEFGPMGKRLHLSLDEVRPIDLNWLTRRLVERVPFLAYRDGLMICDLLQMPTLGPWLDYRFKGKRLADFVTVKELVIREGELVARLGICL